MIGALLELPLAIPSFLFYRVMRVVMQNGRRTLQGSNSGSTDDRGIYRVFGLMPGDYVVRAADLGDKP